jgi:hypothetical protein
MKRHIVLGVHITDRLKPEFPISTSFSFLEAEHPTTQNQTRSPRTPWVV